MLKVRRTISLSPARCFNTGATEASKIGFISRGGPGSKTTVHLPSVISIPGAVPLPFSRICAPLMTSAWRALISGIGMLRRAKRALIFSRILSSRINWRFKTRAKIFRVMSSSVGPSPPVAMTISERFIASRTVSSSCASSSPTTVFSLTSTPIAFSRSVNHSEFVSNLKGVNISEPIAIISALSIVDRRRARQQAVDLACERLLTRQALLDKHPQQRQRHRGVDAGERVVHHHPKPAGQRLEPVDRIRFENVEGAEEREAGDHPPAPARAQPYQIRSDEDERNDLTENLVDYDLARVLVIEYLFSAIARPDAEGGGDHAGGDQDILEK